MQATCNKGPGYSSPEEAYSSCRRESVLYVTTVSLSEKSPDSLVVVDVDPKSETYCQVICNCPSPFLGDEFHHSGWNSCSSCHEDSSKRRNRLFVPCLRSDRILVFDTSDERRVTLHQVIQGATLRDDHDLSAPHTAHCLPTGDVMISCMGDANGKNKGSFLLLAPGEDGNFHPKGTWEDQPVSFGYDFWYQPKFDILVSSEWGSPDAWTKGLLMQDVNANKYGSSIHFWSWKKRKLIKSIQLGDEGLMPLEVRFVHNPDRAEGFVGCAFSSSIFYFHLDGHSEWRAEKVIHIESKEVNNWLMPTMPAVITDILISMDDRFLFSSCWLHGDVRMYDITNPSDPILNGIINLGGNLGGYVTQVSSSSGQEEKEAAEGEGGKHQATQKPSVKGVELRGGPQMMQLSLDGERLYVTNSLFSQWDKQFYPELAEKGSLMLQVNVDVGRESKQRNRLSLNPNFLVDFENICNGPVLAHEMRYPGGDCTSDIFLSKSSTVCTP